MKQLPDFRFSVRQGIDSGDLSYYFVFIARPMETVPREIFKFNPLDAAQTGPLGRAIPGIVEATECRKHDSVYRHVSAGVSFVIK